MEEEEEEVDDDGEGSSRSRLESDPAWRGGTPWRGDVVVESLARGWDGYRRGGELGPRDVSSPVARRRRRSSSSSDGGWRDRPARVVRRGRRWRARPWPGRVLVERTNDDDGRKDGAISAYAAIRVHPRPPSRGSLREGHFRERRSRPRRRHHPSRGYFRHGREGRIHVCVERLERMTTRMRRVGSNGGGVGIVDVEMWPTYSFSGPFHLPPSSAEPLFTLHNDDRRHVG